MKSLTEWDESSPEERREFLKGTLAEKKMNMDSFIDKDWKDLSFFVKQSLVIYMTRL